MREKKKFPALPLGLKSEVLETRMKFHRISRGRDFLEVELLRYWYCVRSKVHIDSIAGEG